MSYMSRSQAARAAKKNHNWVGFMTYFDRTVQVWYNREVQLPIPDAVLTLEKLDFVHHIEWTTGYHHKNMTGEDITKPEELSLCVVVNCRRDEIKSEEIPNGFLIQPLTRDLWQDVSETTHGNGLRAKSEIESPVKVVWRIADEMKGQDRKAVIAACIEAGVNKSTANTQYYKWSKAQEG